MIEGIVLIVAGSIGLGLIIAICVIGGGKNPYDA